MKAWLIKHTSDIRFWGLMLATYGFVTKSAPFSALALWHTPLFHDSLIFMGGALSRFGTAVFRPMMAIALGIMVADILKLQGIVAVVLVLPGVIAFSILEWNLWKSRRKKPAILPF